MADIKRSDWPIVYLPLGAAGDAFASTAAMRLGYAFRNIGYQTYVAARALGMGAYWQVGFPYGGRVYEDTKTCLVMPMFRIEMDYTVNGYVDTSACVTRMPFQVQEPIFNETVPLSVPLFLLAKFAYNPRVVPVTSGLVLGYFQYKIEDYPHPPNLIDHPSENLVAVVPLVHSIYKVFISMSSTKASNMMSALGEDIVVDISELPDKVINDSINFLSTTLGIKDAEGFINNLGIFIYRLLPVMYLVQSTVEG